MRMSSSRHRLFVVFALAALAGAGPALRAEPFDPLEHGPARIRDQFLPSIGYLAFEPQPATLLEPGRWQVEFQLSVSNTFAQSDNIEDALEARTDRAAIDLEEFRSFPVAPGDRGVFQIDGELYYAMFRLRRRLGERYEAAVSVPLLSFGGGHLDAAIEKFHQTTKNDQEGRVAVPKDLVRVYLRSGDTEIYRDRSSSPELGDLALALTRRLGSAERRHPWALELRVELPTGDEASLAGSGSLDAGLRILHTRRYRRLRLDGGLGLLLLGPHGGLDLPSQQVLTGFASVERRFGATVTGFLQATATGSLFDDIYLSEMARLSVGWSIGAKKFLGERTALIFAGSENVSSYDNSPDVGLHFGLSHAFD